MSADQSPSEAAAKMFLKHELQRAPSYQGGHSDEGRRLAGVLGVPFPIRMSALKRRAKKLGFKPLAIWPWLSK